MEGADRLTKVADRRWTDKNRHATDLLWPGQEELVGDLANGKTHFP